MQPTWQRLRSGSESFHPVSTLCVIVGFPVDMTIAYGDITVEMMSEEEQDDWACRHFRINYVSHGAGFQGPSPR